MNGVGGYGGRSNWCVDKNEKRPGLYTAMPGCMKAPWRSNMAEIRVCDVPATNIGEFQNYLAENTGPGKVRKKETNARVIPFS